MSGLPDALDCGPICNYGFEPGAVVTLTATADTGSTFVGWSGAASGLSNPIALMMNSAALVEARFDTPAFALTVNVAGVSTRAVNQSPDLPAYLPGAVVTLTAVPDAARRFTAGAERPVGRADQQSRLSLLSDTSCRCSRQW